MAFIREATADDVPAMARLRALTWGTEEYWLPRVAAYLAGESHPQQALPARVAFVAFDGGETVGLITGHRTHRYGCDGELEWIDVHPSRRGKGTASELLRVLAAWFVARDARRVCVDVDPGNAAARRFYARHGAVPLNPHWLVWEDIGAV